MSGHDRGPTFDLGEGIHVEHLGAEGDEIHLSFFGDRDGKVAELVERRVPSGFYADRTAGGELRNRVLEAVEAEYGDDVNTTIVSGGIERMYDVYRTEIVTDEDLQSDAANQLRNETERVVVHAGDGESTATVRFNHNGHSFEIDFGEAEWMSADCSTKIRNRYWGETGERIEISPEEWEILRDEWDDSVVARVVNEVTHEAEIATELIRLLETWIEPTEDTGRLHADPKNARYDRDNDAHPDAQIRENHDDVDVLWIQTAVINEALNDIPGAKPDRACKVPLAQHLQENGVILRGSKTITGQRIPVWAFDAEVFGGRELLGNDGDGDGGDDREVSL